MWPAVRIAKYFFISGSTLGSIASLKSNNYNVESIGIVRLARAASTVLGITILYKTKLYNTTLNEKSQEYWDLKEKIDKEAAQRLLTLCRENRGVYIKVGQHIGSLDYVLPKEFVQTLRVLHSHCPRSNMDDVFQVIREELKIEPCELFSCFDEEPLGSASLAQVHRAVLKDGTVVAVKVQHPYVRGNSIVDMKTMEVLAKLVAWTFPDFKFNWLVQEFKVNVPVELDFANEGRNAEKAARIFSKIGWLRVPVINWPLTTTRILTMEYLEGGQVDDVDYIAAQKISPVEVSEKLGRLYSDMIFLHGFVHSDPHPGNILVHKSPSTGRLEIMLLDHGLYATLTNEFRWEYSKLWLSILDKDEDRIRLHAKNLGVDELFYLLACIVAGRTWASVVSGVERSALGAAEQEEMSDALGGHLGLIADVLTRVNRQLLLVLKTNDLLRSNERTLGTQYRKSSFLVMSRCCVKAVYGQRLAECETSLCRWRTRLAERWALLKLWLYYVYLHATAAFNPEQADVQG